MVAFDAIPRGTLVSRNPASLVHLCASDRCHQSLLVGEPCKFGLERQPIRSVGGFSRKLKFILSKIIIDRDLDTGDSD